MSHMKPEIYLGAYYTVETTDGTEVIPAELCGALKSETWVAQVRDYCQGKPRYPQDMPEEQTGYLYRMSAPGYLDSTEWGAADTEAEARQTLDDMHGDE